MRTLLLFVLLFALLALVWSRGWRPPARYDPWAPLDLRAPPDLFFRYKLQRLGADTRSCESALARAGARFEPVADRHGPGSCGWRGAVRLDAIGGAKFARPAIVTCPLAASLVLLEREVLQPAARDLYGRSVARIDHLGSYACRNLCGRAAAPLSRHARAEAIDLAGFELQGGRVLQVADDRNGHGRAAVFLHRVQDRACEVAGMVLGPGYNAEHRGHFHFHFHVQAGGWGYCR